MKNFKPNLQSGLTLVETLVAITVLIVGVIGPLSIAAQGIGDGIFARNQIAANYLSQEALEVMVNKRYAAVRQAQYLPVSGNFFESDPALQQCINAGRSCVVNAKDGSVTYSVNADDTCDECRLVFNTNSGLYQFPGQAGDLGPEFRRKVYLVTSPGAVPGQNDRLKVTVTVTWNNKDIPKSLTISEDLFSKG